MSRASRTLKLAGLLLAVAFPAWAQNGVQAGEAPGCQLNTACQALTMAIGGAVLGTDNLAVTGSATVSGQVSGASFVPTSATVPVTGVYSASAGAINFATGSTNRLTIQSAGGITAIGALAANNGSSWQLRTAAASSTVPSVVPNQTSLNTGIGAQASGNMSLIGVGVEMMRITSTLITLPTIGSDATHTDSAVCQDTTSHALYAGSGTLGVCLGTSSARYKQEFTPLKPALSAVRALRPGNYFYKPEWGDGGAREQYGFLAEDVITTLPKLVALDAEGLPNTVDILGMVPVLVKAIQEQEVEIATLRAQIAQLIPQ